VYTTFFVVVAVRLGAAVAEGRVLREGMVWDLVTGFGFTVGGRDDDPAFNAFALRAAARLASFSFLACSRFLARSCFFFSWMTQASSYANCFLA